MEKTSQEIVQKLFRKIDVFDFTNVLEFNSADALYEYWTSYNWYDEQLEAEFLKAAKDFFKSNECFKTTKCVVGIRCVK